MSKKTPKNITGENYHIMVGNALDRLKELPDNSVDSIVTDPPYGLSDNKFVAETIAKWIEGEREFIPDGKGFMGKAWDAFVPPPAIWDECMRVLKPGGHLLAFFGTRTQDIGALAIRLAGFEIRDSVAWLYGSGFPKSLDISKSIEAKLTTGSANKTAFKNLEGEKVERGNWGIAKQQVNGGQRETNYDETAGETRLGKLTPSTDAAKQYEGWGTALKPAHEPIVVARKPISEKTVANNVLQWGTGGLNIDASRVGTEYIPAQKSGSTSRAYQSAETTTAGGMSGGSSGRFPANLILSHSEDCQDTGETVGDTFGGGAKASSGFVNGYEGDGFVASSASTPVYRCVPGCPVAELDSQSGDRPTGAIKPYKQKHNGKSVASFSGNVDGTIRDFKQEASSGGASRFFYVAKTNKKDRNEGLDGLPLGEIYPQNNSLERKDINATKSSRVANFHPTVKPTALMEYLVRMVTPEGGTVLDPFTGSGSTGKAALLNGFKFIGCELTEDYLPIIEGRLSWAEANKEQYQADKVKAAQKAAKVEHNTASKATGGSLTPLDGKREGH